MEQRAPIDRLAVRVRPKGEPIMGQRWNNSLFLHWPIDVERVRPLIPSGLELDTHEGRAWISITPFHVDSVRPSLFRFMPGVNAFHELNVRTYVVHQGIPGVWFCSLDASRLLPTVAARIFFGLPYYRANIRFFQSEVSLMFTMKRTLPANAEFKASWRTGIQLRDPDVDSLAFFLVERYCLFVSEDNQLQVTRIYHRPWILQEAEVKVHSSTVLKALGLPEPQEPPLIHFSRSLDVEIWPPTMVGRAFASSSDVKTRERAHPGG